MSIRRRLTASVVTLLAVIVLTSCALTPSNPSSNDPENPMNITEARKEHLDLFVKIQALAPGDWSEVSPNQPVDSCKLPGGGKGLQVAYHSDRPPLSEKEMDALNQKVKEVFEANGYRVEQSKDPGANFVQRTNAFGPDKFSMGLTTGQYEISLTGNTRCSPPAPKK